MWRCRGGLEMLYISRFADATLAWAAEGVQITMSHDYLTRDDAARVDFYIDTLEQPIWDGSIQVRRRSLHLPNSPKVNLVVAKQLYVLTPSTFLFLMMN